MKMEDGEGCCGQGGMFGLKLSIFFSSQLSHQYPDPIIRNPTNPIRPDDWPIEGVGISQQEFSPFLRLEPEITG